MDKKMKDLRKQSKTMDASIIIGKNGITDQTIQNIKTELQKNRIVKVKVLQTFIEGKDKEQVFNEIAEKAKAKIVHKLGFTVTLTK